MGQQSCGQNPLFYSLKASVLLRQPATPRVHPHVAAQQFDLRAPRAIRTKLDVAANVSGSRHRSAGSPSGVMRGVGNASWRS